MKKVQNRICYILFFILNILIMRCFHSYINFVFMILLLIFPVCSIAMLNTLKKQIQFKMMISNTSIQRNQECYLRFILSNPTWFPLLNTAIHFKIENTLYHISGEHDLKIPLRIKNEIEVTYPLRMEYCGHISFGAQTIKLTDLLGIYEVELPLRDQKECLVIPCGIQKMDKTKELYGKGISESVESKKKGNDFSEISGIREYIPGDKLQNIHWKLSAKKEEFLVKERVNISSLELVIILDLGNDESMCLESTLELFEGITSSFVKQQLPFTTYFYSSNSLELKSEYVSNEVERQQLMEMILYDQCSEEVGIVEEIFLKKYPMRYPYLYIGNISGGEDIEDAILGNQQVAAILREG